VYFGSLNNQRSILEMMQIVAEHPQDICMIVGWVWPLLGEVNRIAAANPERIKFLWKVEYSEVLSISNKADILFSIYNPEIPNNKFASPNKIFEAMYLGKPIIVSKNTTMMRYVEDMNIWIWVTYGNISEILAAVNRCMSMSTSEKMIQKRNNKQAYEKYSAKTMQSELLWALNLI
jgi:glycosyltransferase involved in cell wall biosynthesis